MTRISLNFCLYRNFPSRLRDICGSGGKKDCKSLRSHMTKEIASFRSNRFDSHIICRLWQNAQNLCKLKPDETLIQRRTEAQRLINKQKALSNPELLEKWKYQFVSMEWHWLCQPRFGAGLLLESSWPTENGPCVLLLCLFYFALLLCYFGLYCSVFVFFSFLFDILS